VDPAHQELIRASFAKVAIMPEVTAALFYERLFTVNPSFRPLFKNDMRIQGIKLMTMVTMVVYNLHQPGETLSAIRNLGQRHVGYGVKPTDYDAVADALSWAFEQVLEEDFTPEVRNAWSICYQQLACEMKSAAADA
jgi:hemoglobin-like flavoprotein